jgi:hypothetical protein
MDHTFKVTEIIKKEIADGNVSFVFPSGIAASLWARKACEFAGVRSVRLDRFMAWDDFKEQVILTEEGDKRPVPEVIRKLFAEQLVKKNAGEKFFQSLIPPEYAESGGVFASSIAAVLPALGYWEDRVQHRADYTADDEDRDYIVLKTEYAAFLEQRGLFEPSWKKPALRDQRKQYYIFFPEAIEDYGEYGELLEKSENLRIIRREKDQEPLTLRRYPSVRAEIRGLVLDIRRLHETEGIPYEDMAVNVPELEDLAPYLLREFSLYDIPCRRGAGKALSGYGAGRLFTLMQNCAANDFSFSALKSLLLDIHIPWARPDLNRELIAFGVSHNCVSSYREENRVVDIWREAFKTSPRDELLSRYYGGTKDEPGLKGEMNAIVKAKTFFDIRRFYFAFRDLTLDMSRCPPESDAVLARCVEELSGLIRLEKEYPGLTPDDPFAFYVSLLGNIRYVPDQKQGGVNIFPYRVATAAPFRCHFEIGRAHV